MICQGIAMVWIALGLDCFIRWLMLLYYWMFF